MSSSEDSGGTLDVTDLVGMFEASEDFTAPSRKLSERDRDYHDNIQLSAEEKAVLRKRGQPEYIDNRIKTKVDYLVGLEKQQRINPRALPRTPMHEDDADSASQALNFVADEEQFDHKRSAIWRNLLIEGSGGMAVAVEQRGNEMYVCLRRVPWDRMFYDPHSAELDFSDAGYLGTVQWMDLEDAVQLYGEASRDTFTETMNAAQSNTYDDKPRFDAWADKKRKRVRIVSMWIKRGEEWYFAEFTKGGILKAGPSPYKDDKGRSDCELFFQSAYVDRENNRFGLVREMILLQDAINKRNSKALHQLNTAQIVTNQVSIANQDVEKLRKEAARPDGVIILSGDTGQDQFHFETRNDLAASQVALLQESKQAIDLKGPNATQMGNATGTQGDTASGRAILASQQGGMVSLGDLLDNLRHLDKRVFRAIWNRIRQFWTAEKWVRVTDDEQNIKWIGMNVDPAMMQQFAAQNPEAARRISGVIGSVAQLDVDIIIDEAPDSVTPALEQWQGLVDLAKSGVAIPPKVLVKAAPNLKNKKALLDEMDKAGQPDPIQQAGVKLELEGKAAENEKTQAETDLLRVEAGTTVAEAGQGGGAPMQPQVDPSQLIDLKGKLSEMQHKERMHEMDVESGALKLEGQRMDIAARQQELQHQSDQANADRTATAETNAQTVDGMKGVVQDAAATIAQVFNGLGELIVQQGNETQQSIAQLADAMSAPTELVRDDKGRAIGSRKVMPQRAA